jgi:hypothetical protein
LGIYADYISNKTLVSEQFWTIPLKEGIFGCGRVIQVNGYTVLPTKTSLIGLMDWKDKTLPTYDSIAGNVYPLEIRQWFNKMLTNQKISEQERVKIETIIGGFYQGTPLVNLKKSINQMGIPIGICRSPIGNI